MPLYAYKGFNQAGKPVTGTLDAESPRTIKASLRKDGIFIVELNETTPAKKSANRQLPFAAFLTERVSAQDMAATTRQLSTLVGAGIPLVQALTALVDQVDNEHFKSVWGDVKTRVNEGAGFGDSLSAHP